MSRSVSTDLKNHIAGELTTLATCWRIRRQDDTVEGWTDHDETITYGGVAYTPIEAGNPAIFRTKLGAGVEATDIEIAFSVDSDKDTEMRAGLYDYAQVWTFMINWADTTQGIIKLQYGRMGESEIRDNVARIELRSLTQLLGNTIGRIYTPECSASLGDSRCGVSMAGYTHTGVVNVVTNDRIFSVSGDASGRADGYFNYGKMTFSSGLNSGITMQIQASYASSMVYLLEHLPYSPANGDAFTASAGCDRRWATCRATFNNKDRFRGFPHIPGMDKAMYVPANRQWTTS